jgi:thioesterase domain-containing protein/acyl carrier protein
VPGTGYLELAAEALRAQGETGPFEIRDLFFLRSLKVDAGKPRDVRVRLSRSEEGYGFAVSGACVAEGRDAFELNAQASLALLPQAAAGTIDLEAIAARCAPPRTATGADALRSPQEAHLRFGPRWRVLRDIAFGKDEGLATLRLPAAFADDLEQGYLLHPALLDLATGWAMELIAGYEPTHLWVPVSYRSVRVFGPLPQQVKSWVRNAGPNRAEGPFAEFDVTLCDADGSVLVEIEGFSIRRLAGAADLAQARRPGASELEFVDGARSLDAPLSPAEERLLQTYEQGIRPEEGAEAFARAMAAGLPQIVVSSLDLGRLVADAGAAEVAAAGGQVFQRPELDSAYVEPRNDIERMLAGFWQELLGVERVGVEDSFFDLGGHSLIAVRLFVMIRKAFRVEFPISVLFEAPTIATCAALIAERIGHRDAPADGAPAAPAAPARRFTHLVAMHEGEGGPKTPFFLVAGMFGNVLNLRHLAHLIGSDRRFYGVQARGLYGDAAPHETFEAAAADYIAELRMVQPHGPYLLGGFSGGGIAAYEMARQLEAEGERVSLVVMLDTPIPMRPILSRIDRALIKLQEIRGRGLGYFREWAQARARWELDRVRARFDRPVEALDHAFHNDAIEAAFRAALPRYDLAPWSGKLALFRPALDRKWQVSGGRFVDSEREYVMADNGWSPWAPLLEVVEVPGDHDSMVLEPNVRVLAARLRRCIDAAEAAQDDAYLRAPLATAAE